MTAAKFSSRSMKTVLITGATGFLGKHLTQRLSGGEFEVRVLIRNKNQANDLSAPNVQVYIGDVTQPETLAPAVQGADTIIHSAGMLGPAHAPIEEYRKVNAEGTQNLIDASRTAGSVERFVQVSSVGVLGPGKPKEIACEGTPPKPTNTYEITKLEGEEIALDAARTGFPAVVVRPAWIYGPGDTRTVKLFRMIAKKRFFIVGKAHNRQHPVYIDDVVSGVIRSAEIQGIEGRVYHLAGPDIVKVETLCQTVADELKVKLPPFRIPRWVVLTPAYAVEMLYSIWGGDPPVDHRKVDFFMIERAYSISRAKKEMGWEPQTRFKDGIAQTIQWYRENHYL